MARPTPTPARCRSFLEGWRDDRKRLADSTLRGTTTCRRRGSNADYRHKPPRTSPWPSTARPRPLRSSYRHATPPRPPRRAPSRRCPAAAARRRLPAPRRRRSPPGRFLWPSCALPCLSRRSRAPVPDWNWLSVRAAGSEIPADRRRARPLRGGPEESHAPLGRGISRGARDGRRARNGTNHHDTTSHLNERGSLARTPRTSTWRCRPRPWARRACPCSSRGSRRRRCTRPARPPTKR